MKSGRCPKCSNTEIISNQNSMVKGEHCLVHHGIFTTISSTCYICTQCGYVEDYVDQDLIPKLRKKWN